MESADPLRVPPRTEIPKYSSFTQILVITTRVNVHKETFRTGTWAPIALVELGNIKQTIKIVSAADLANVTIEGDHGSSQKELHEQLASQVLISDSYLDYRAVKRLIAQLQPVDTFYSDLEDLLSIYEQIGCDDAERYQDVLNQLSRRAAESHTKYRKPPMEKERRDKPERDDDDYPSLKNLSENDMDRELRDKFQAAFNTLRFKLYSPLSYSEEKIHSFIHIVELLKTALLHFERSAKPVPGSPTVPNNMKLEAPVLPTPLVVPTSVIVHQIAQLPPITAAPGDPVLSFPMPAPQAPCPCTPPLSPDREDPDVSEGFLSYVDVPQLPRPVENHEPYLPNLYNRAFTPEVPKSVTLRAVIEDLLCSPDMCIALAYADQLPITMTRILIERILKFLIQEEIRDVVNINQPITFDMPYILPIGVIPGLPSLKQCLENADYYTSGILKVLDLSCSYVTGSLIPACAGLPLPGISTKYTIDSLYPSKYTVPTDYDKYRRIMKNVFNLDEKGTLVAANRQPVLAGILTISKNGDTIEISDGIETATLHEEDGADIDIAVDIAPGEGDDEKFQAVAAQHLAAVRTLYPNVGMRRVDKKASYTLEIIGGPRTIQIYRSTLRHIVTHHVGMVRGLITGNGAWRNLYLSAICAKSLLCSESYNYYFFAGKSTPMEIILKYKQRGYNCKLVAGGHSMMREYCDKHLKWIYAGVNPFTRSYNVNDYPILNGYGNFNICNLRKEVAFYKYNDQLSGYRGGPLPVSQIEIDMLLEVLDPYGVSYLKKKIEEAKKPVVNNKVRKARPVKPVAKPTNVTDQP